MTELKAISISKTNLLSIQNASQSLGKIITNLKALEYLDLSNAFSDVQQAKEIADGIMRAK